ncbi:hypothetical protein [Haladaptatus sp. DJG-WS-42]|uniref:hypothetical protein n=1 Tax=Haladaptatus sp. DJG-WS-42 TaxID=3120516 RepID=UPI0030CAE776
MRLWGDNRGQAIQIGAVLLFATLIIALSLYQATVVPQNNKEVEFNHNLQVQDQLVEMRNALVRTAGTGTAQPVSVTLGTQYAARVFTVNPGRPGGTLETVPLGTVSIANATAVGDYEYWNGTTRTYETKGLVYRPGYNEYTNAPNTVYENSVLYNTFEGTENNTVLADQSVLNGRQITLVLVNGSYQESSTGSATLNTKPVSVSTNTVALTNNGTDPLKLTLPTRMSWEAWNETLDGQSAFLEQTTYTTGDPNTITLWLKGGETYTLRMAKVGLGTQIQDEQATYLTSVSDTNLSVEPGESVTFTAEVRDALNNPVSGVVVNESHSRVTPVTTATDESGHQTFRYDAPDVELADTDPVALSISDGSKSFQTVTYNIDVSTGGGTSEPNEYTVEWADQSDGDIADEQGVISCAESVCTYRLSDDPNSKLTLTADILGSTFANVDFTVNNSSVISNLNPTLDVSQDPDGDGDSSVSTEATIAQPGVVSVVASTTEDTDRFTLIVEQGEEPSLTYNGDAVATDQSGDGTESGVFFSVNNGNTDAVTITDVRVEPDDTNIDELSDPSGNQGQWQSELHIDADSRDGTFDINNGDDLPMWVNQSGEGYNEQQSAILSGGADATFYLYEFLDNNNPQDMADEPVEITVEYEYQGVTYTETFTITPESEAGPGGPGQSVAYPTSFNDDESPEPETDEDESIPPSGTIGDIENFDNLQAENGNSAVFTEAPTSGSGSTKYGLDTGLAVTNIADSTGYDLTIRHWVLGSGNEDFSVRVVDADGNNLGTTETIPDSTEYITTSVPLSQDAVDYINDNGEVYLIIEDTSRNGDNTEHEIRVDYVRIEAA